MKRIILCITLCALLITTTFLCACGGDSAAEQSAGPVSEPVSEPGSEPGFDLSDYLNREKIKPTYQVVGPCEDPPYVLIDWAPFDDDSLKNLDCVVSGTVTEVVELALGYVDDYGTDPTRYISLLTVTVNDVVKGSVVPGDTVTVLYEMSSYFCDKECMLAEAGTEYVFFLKSTSDLPGRLDYTDIADYMYYAPGNFFRPASYVQVEYLTRLIGSRKYATGEEFIAALKEHYKEIEN